MRAPLSGPQITPYLRYQTDLAWKQDEARQKIWASIHTEKALLKEQAALRQKLLQMIGGLPTEKTALHPRITGKIQMEGYSIEKLIFRAYWSLCHGTGLFSRATIRKHPQFWSPRATRPTERFTIRH